MKRCTVKALTGLTCLLLSSQLLISQACHADTEREGQWLHYLQQGQTEGMTMPHPLNGDNDMISLSQSDVKRLLGLRDAGTSKRSKLQFTRLNYQADVSDKSLQLRLFVQF
ncbi:MAG: hypothetical protein ACRBBW_12245 [Cellvibrionaceae bacterium]